MSTTPLVETAGVASTASAAAGVATQGTMPPSNKKPKPTSKKLGMDKTLADPEASPVGCPVHTPDCCATKTPLSETAAVVPAGAGVEAAKTIRTPQHEPKIMVNVKRRVADGAFHDAVDRALRDTPASESTVAAAEAWLRELRLTVTGHRRAFEKRASDLHEDRNHSLRLVG